MRILLADDSRAMRTVYRTVLDRVGHPSGAIVEAKEAREVLAALEDHETPVDMIVFDWDLPGMDGLALMAQLKMRGLAGKVSVLFSVNRQQRALLPQAVRVGPCEGLDRPFTEETFEKKFRALRPLSTRESGSSKGLRPMPSMPDTDGGKPFLARVPSAMVDDLLKLADEREHFSGAVLLRAGQICDSLHIVMRGQVELTSAGKTIRTSREGDLFGEFSFMMSEPSGYTATAKTLALTASLSKARIADLLRKHPGLHNHISALFLRHKDAMTARATTIMQSDFKGTFDTMPFANVIQVLSIGRKTGILGIRQEELSGGIYLDNGEALHAWTENSEGEEAFYALSGWTEAKWAFNSIRREERRTLTKATITLLMEAMRRIEEKGPSAPPPENAGPESLFPPQ
jgi:two-component system, chemotaxis family, chemotaxis protein CheY